MPGTSVNRDIAFTLSDVARLLRTHADQKAAQYGMTRAQWAVLVRLARFEGIKQTELAEMLDLQPITLTRLLDRLCENELIERRPDLVDRRVKRLYLRPAAQPVLERLAELGEELMATALAGLDRRTIEALLSSLVVVKENLRQAIQKKQATGPERQYG
jgi:MarR family transcriptional regulator for hemolysin